MGTPADTAWTAGAGTLVGLLKALAGFLASLVTNTTGSSTAARQDIGNAALTTIATNTGTGAVGGATAVNQTTGNTSLATIATNTAGVATAAGQATGNTSLATIAAGVATEATAALQTAGNTTLAAIVTAETAGNTFLTAIAASEALTAAASGTPVDVAWVSGAGTLIGLLKGVVGKLSGTLTATLSGALPAGGNAIGTVGVTALPALPAGANAIGSVSVSNFPPSTATPTGTAGTPNASVVTVQGISGGTAQPTVASGSTRTDYSANALAVPISGYVLVATIPATPSRAAWSIYNLSGAQIQYVFDDGLGMAGTVSSALLAGGSGSPSQGGSDGNATFKGRIRVTRRRLRLL